MYHETGNTNWQIVATILSATTAILALIASPLYSYYLAKKQIASTVLSNERKEWIYALRLDVATFVSNIFGIIAAGKHFDKINSESNATRLYDLITTTSSTLTKIQILLDPSNQTQNELSTTAQKMFHSLLNSREEYAKSEEFSKAMNTIIPLTQSVVRQELGNIKKLL